MAIVHRQRGALWSPRLAPPVPVAIDWADPLAYGLQFYYAFSTPNAFADVAGRWPTLTPYSGGTLVPRQEGVALSGGQYGGCVSPPISGSSPLAWTGAASVMWAGRWITSPVTNHLFGLENSDRYAEPYGYLTFEGSSSAVGLAGNGITYAGTAPATLTSGNFYVFVLTITGSGQFIYYVNGVPASSVSTSLAGISWAGATAYVQAGQRMGGVGITYAMSHHYAGAAWSRALTASEVLALSLDPWRVLRPARPLLRGGIVLSYAALSAAAGLRGAGRVPPSAATALSARGAGCSPGRANANFSAPVVGAMAGRAAGRIILSTAAAMAGRGAGRANARSSVAAQTALSALLASRAAARVPPTASVALQARASLRASGRALVVAVASLAARAGARSRLRSVLTATTANTPPPLPFDPPSVPSLAPGRVPALVPPASVRLRVSVSAPSVRAPGPGASIVIKP